MRFKAAMLLSVAAAVGGGVAFMLLAPPRGATLPLKDCLRLLPGPLLCNRTNAQGVAGAFAIVALSNAGPRRLMFAFSPDELRWESGKLHGYASLSSGR